MPGTTSLSAAALLAMPALAAASVISVIEYDALTQHQENAWLTGAASDVHVFSIGGTFRQKSVGGVTATGVSGGGVPGEIDGSQSINFTFDRPVSVNALSVAFLYTAGNYGDTTNERALFSTDAGSFTLEAAGATAPLWSGFGEAFNVSPGIEGHGGLWTVAGDDIFGEPITSLALSSGNPGTHAKFGDFSFYSIAYTVVPAHGGVALLAGAFIAGSRRRRS